MSKKLSKEQEAFLKKEFGRGFEEQFKNGLAQGVYAVSKVVFDKASNEELSPEERLADIANFCKVSLDVNSPKAGTQNS